jgi:phage minor structural protein|nr:MAG TPA: tail protein [Caudoviricetes sp.]
MNPVLYESTESTFETNGLGVLSDTISCQVVEERNGIFEITLEYPLTGIHYQEIKQRRIIFVKPNPYEDPQPFRIYRITKPLSGKITVYAQHISYDLSGVPVSPFSSGSVTGALSGLKTNAAVTNPFSFWTDKTSTGDFAVTAPTSTRTLLGGSDGSILDVFGGEYKFDRWTIRLYNNRGKNSGVSIRYGKNLMDLQQDENISNVVTGIYPYWLSSEGELTELPEKIVNAPGTYDFTRISAIDFSGDFEEAPTEEQLRDRANDYISSNNVGVPTVSITVEFQPLEQTEEYKDIALLERVNLCDTVNVEYSELGVSATAKCVKTTYDALKDKYISIELGDAKTNIADTIIQQQQEINEKPSVSFLEQAVINATNWITGNKGGYVIFQRNADGQPYEILIMDTPDINTATKVWRWNNGGLGYSSNGYEGPFATAITQDGAIVANFITTGTLQANLIKSGIIQSRDGRAYFNLDTGQIAATQLIAQSSAIGQYSAYIGKASNGGLGFIITRNGDMFFHTNANDTGSSTTLYGGNSRVSFQVNDAFGFYIEYNYMNVISVGLDKSEISSPIKTLRLGGAAITPSECFSGDFKAGDYRLYVNNGLITSIRNES